MDGFGDFPDAFPRIVAEIAIIKINWRRIVIRLITLSS